MKPARGIGLLVGLLLLTGSLVSGGEPTWQEQQNLPEWTAPVLAEKAFASTYALSTRLNPFFLHGDFNGDGRLDVAVLIVHKTTGQQGIAMFHAGAQTAIPLGAGRAVGNGGVDFSWLDAWSVSVKPAVQIKRLPAPRSHPAWGIDWTALQNVQCSCFFSHGTLT